MSRGDLIWQGCGLAAGIVLGAVIGDTVGERTLNALSWVVVMCFIWAWYAIAEGLAR